MKKKTVYLILFCLVLCFIWGNSVLSREVSGAISKFIADIFGGEGGASEGGHHLVRKLAHFTEFLALGAVFWLLSGEYTRERQARVFSASLVGLAVPLIDETIQIFSGRGPAIADVWIDASGFAVGSALTALILLLHSRSRARRRS